MKRSLMLVTVKLLFGGATVCAADRSAIRYNVGTGNTTAGVDVMIVDPLGRRGAGRFGDRFPDELPHFRQTAESISDDVSGDAGAEVIKGSVSKLTAGAYALVLNALSNTTYFFSIG